MSFNPDRMVREVYCYTCKDTSIATDGNPKCPICGANLITVTYSALTGKRITGNEEKNEDKPST